MRKSGSNILINENIGGAAADMNRFSEKDWKLFRSKIAGWQEAYMDKLNKEYMEILSGKGNPTDKFWKLEKRINEDKKDCGVQCQMSRSKQFDIMMSLLNEGAITLEDLEDFSDDLKKTISYFYSRFYRNETE